MTPVDRDPLELLASGAAAALAAPNEAAIDDMVEIAALAAGGRRRRRRARATLAMASAAAALVLALTAAWSLSASTPGPLAEAPVTAPRTPASPATPTTSTLSLPSGDIVHSLAEAALTLTEASSTHTSFALERGAALFDIAPRTEGATVSVQTPHGAVTVLGTVFTVRVDDSDTYVAVFEGRVHLERQGEEVELVTGQRAMMNGLGDTPAWESPLHALGLEAAGTRALLSRLSAAPEAEPAMVETTPEPPEHLASPLPNVGIARGWLRGGDVARAMRAAERARTDRPRDGAYRMLYADALRGEGRYEAAARAYDEAAELLSPSRATHAGLLSAGLRLRHLDDPEQALASLARTHAADPGSPVEERGLTLRVRCLLALGRPAEARDAASNYSLRFPAGAAITWMRELIGPR